MAEADQTPEKVRFLAVVEIDPAEWGHHFGSPTADGEATTHNINVELAPIGVEVGQPIAWLHQTRYGMIMVADPEVNMVAVGYNGEELSAMVPPPHVTQFYESARVLFHHALESLSAVARRVARAQRDEAAKR